MIHVSLSRIDAEGHTGGQIVHAATWVIIHGRHSAPGDFTAMGSALARRQPGAQVLLLDWHEGAADNGPTGGGGSAWIPLVADWASQKLHTLGLRGDEIALVGHSWGVYLAYDIAANWTDGSRHGVRSLVALDPAIGGMDLNAASINLRSVASWSLAFFDNDVLASSQIALTANEAYSLQCGGWLTNPVAKHWACVTIFDRLLSPNDLASTFLPLTRLFSASAPSSDGTGDSVQPQQLLSDFTMVLHLDQSIAGTWNLIRSLTFHEQGRATELVVDAR